MGIDFSTLKKGYDPSKVRKAMLPFPKAGEYVARLDNIVIDQDDNGAIVLKDYWTVVKVQDADGYAISESAQSDNVGKGQDMSQAQRWAEIPEDKKKSVCQPFSKGQEFWRRQTGDKYTTVGVKIAQLAVDLGIVKDAEEQDIAELAERLTGEGESPFAGLVAVVRCEAIANAKKDEAGDYSLFTQMRVKKALSAGEVKGMLSEEEVNRFFPAGLGNSTKEELASGAQEPTEGEAPAEVPDFD